MKSENYIPIFVWILASVLLVLAVFKLPYGYYQFLRIIITGISVYIVYQEYKLTDKFYIYMVLFGIIALLFNPLIPIYFNKLIWTVIDLTAAGIFAVFGIYKSKK